MEGVSLPGQISCMTRTKGVTSNLYLTSDTSSEMYPPLKAVVTVTMTLTEEVRSERNANLKQRSCVFGAQKLPDSIFSSQMKSVGILETNFGLMAFGVSEMQPRSQLYD